MVLLARNASAHTVLRTASAADSDLDQLAAADDERRNATHRAFVEMLTSNGPLRDGLSISDATDTMSALANPDTYALLTQTGHRSAKCSARLGPVLDLSSRFVLPAMRAVAMGLLSC